MSISTLPSDDAMGSGSPAERCSTSSSPQSPFGRFHIKDSILPLISLSLKNHPQIIYQPVKFSLRKRTINNQFLTTVRNPMSQTQEFIVRILKLKEVLTRTGLGKTTLYMLISNGDFPQQIPLGLRAVGWLESEIDAWILDKIESRNRITS